MLNIDKFKEDKNREYKYVKEDEDNKFSSRNISEFYDYRKKILEDNLIDLKDFLTNELIKVVICENSEIVIKFIP